MPATYGRARSPNAPLVDASAKRPYLRTCEQLHTFVLTLFPGEAEARGETDTMTEDSLSKDRREV
jgi:hypothetical protein